MSDKKRAKTDGNLTVSRTTLWRKKRYSMVNNMELLEEENIEGPSQESNEWYNASASSSQSQAAVELTFHSDELGTSSEMMDSTEPEHSTHEFLRGSFGSDGDCSCDDTEEWFDCSENDTDTQEWFDDNDDSSADDSPLYPGAPLTIMESLLLILNFVYSHHISGTCLSDLLTLISLHCPSANICINSLYKFKKYFKDVNNPVTVHKFCGNCSYPLLAEEKTEICNICSSDLCSKKSVSYFIEIPIKQQVIDLFLRPGFYAETKHRENRKKKNYNNIEDIYDGSLYKDCMENDEILSKDNTLSLMWYTDGIPLFESSKFSIWPIIFTINELQYNKRTKMENIIFGGLWFGEKKPEMLTFWKPLHKSLAEMRNSGVEVKSPSHSEPFIVKILLLCGTCDLPAKCLVLNMVQFNGKYGCPKCLQPGKSITTGKGFVWTFPFDNKNIDGPIRTHEGTLQDAKDALQNQKITNGIKGPTWISNLQPDIIAGTATDYMHAVLLGVVRKLLSLWFDSSFSKEIFSLSKYVKEVDCKLLNIQPPSFISRTPRSIAEHKAYWKASECRSWLFYYSLPILYKIMDVEYFKHYMLLVEAVYTMNKSSISDQDINHCHQLMVHFVSMYMVLYGERYMSANVHNLLHLPRVVKELGPLWVYSCFPLEDLNGRLLKLFHGTQHPEVQIVSAVSTLAKLPELNFKLLQNPSCRDFIYKLSNHLTWQTEDSKKQRIQNCLGICLVLCSMVCSFMLSRSILKTVSIFICYSIG